MKGPEYKNYRIVMDLDLTLCGPKPPGGDYSMCEPRPGIIETLREYHAKGYYIIIQSARQMNTYANSIGEINVHTLPVAIEWLKKHDVPFDELLMGKPWCGHRGFYVDDRAIRPSEFKSMTPEQIEVMLDAEKLAEEPCG
jgi:capsule biosynthesis phosphatase